MNQTNTVTNAEIIARVLMICTLIVGGILVISTQTETYNETHSETHGETNGETHDETAQRDTQQGTTG